MTTIAVTTTYQARWDEIRAALAPDEVVFVREDGDDFAAASAAEVALVGPNPDRVRKLLAAAPRLRWLQTVSAGVERLIIPEIVERDDLILTNNTGAYDIPIAEHAMAFVFAAAKHLPGHFAAQRERKWRDDPGQAELRDATIVILGLGSIGSELARLASAVGMHVLGIRRRAGASPHAHGVVGPDELPRVAALADYLAITAALTPATRGIVSAEVIARLKTTAWVIDVARGAIADEPALLAACRERRIAGVAFDTWWTEPLPKDSEWWSLPNVIVTPHVSHSSSHVRQRTLALFKENLRRWKLGEPLLNIVDKEAGY